MPFPIYTHSSISTFDGTESPLSEGGLWTTYSGWGGGMAKTSGQMHGSAVSTYCASILSGTYTDFELILEMPTFAAASDYIEIQVRATDMTLTTYEGYRISADAGVTIQIYKMVNGSETTLLDSLAVPAWASGDKIGVQAIGSTIGLWRYDGASWSELMSGTDSTYTSGQVAIGCYSNVYRFDNLTIGTPAVAATNQSFQLLGIS